MPLIKYRRYRPDHAAVMVPALGGASYTGPGDVVGSALGWWGLRAYNAAYATGSNPAIDITDQSNANALTVNILSDGSLDVASISSWVTANSVSSILIQRLYDQTGGAHHAVQNTSFFRPVLILSGLGSLPVIRFPGGNDVSFAVTLAGSTSQPFTASAVSKRSGDFTTEQWIGGTVATAVALWGYNNGANLAKMHAGTAVTATASDSSFHGLQFVFNSSSSDINVDGAANTVNAGTNALQASFDLGKGASQGGTVNGDIVEFGLWGSAFTGTQSTNMNSNQQGYWGY